MKYQAVIFDFNGVLCVDRFYEKKLRSAYDHLYQWIQKTIFTDQALLRDWMTGRKSSSSINAMIAEKTNFDFALLHSLFLASVRGMVLDVNILNVVRALKKQDIRLGLVTDNMDVFTKVIVPENNLDKVFKVIINSADEGRLKEDDHGKLFELAWHKLDTHIEQSLLIDDTPSTIALYQLKGGDGHIFTTFSHLENFLYGGTNRPRPENI